MLATKAPDPSDFTFRIIFFFTIADAKFADYILVPFDGRMAQRIIVEMWKVSYFLTRNMDFTELSNKSALNIYYCPITYVPCE